MKAISDRFSWRTYALFILALVGVMLLCICAGSVSIPLQDTLTAMWNTLWGMEVPAGISRNIIMNVRTDGRPKWQNSGAIENCGMELSAAWRIDRNWRIAGNYSFLHMERPVPLSPRHKAYCAATFTGGRWTAQTSLQYVDGLYLDTDGGEQERYLLWNVRGCFRLNRTVELFARGENLLAQSYEETKGFPMPRATFMAGLAVNL